MVSVREAHFNDVDFNLEDWVVRYVDDAEDARVLLELLRTVQAMPMKDAKAHDALMSRAREMIEILAPLNMDLETLQAAVLFSVQEAGLLPQEKLVEKFGDKLGNLVASVVTMNAIGSLKLSEQSRSAEMQIDRKSVV